MNLSSAILVADARFATLRFGQVGAVHSVFEGFHGRRERSGLGLEAQKADIERYLSAHGSAVKEFIETESGKSHKNRHELLTALDACRKHRATFHITRLDRLARNVAFIASLIESGVEFVAVDMPHASKFMIHILAAVAEHERELILKRTKAALAAATKARGVRLGGPDPMAALAKANAAKEAPATGTACSGHDGRTPRGNYFLSPHRDGAQEILSHYATRTRMSSAARFESGGQLGSAQSTAGWAQLAAKLRVQSELAETL